MFSPLKELAIEYTDPLLSSPANRLGLLFSPGDSSSRGYKLSSALATAAEPANNWSYSVDQEHQLSDESCVYFSNSEISLVNRYTLPQIVPHLSTTDIVNDIPMFLDPNPLRPSVHLALSRINSEYLNSSLNTRQTIYYRRARSFQNSPDAENIILAILATGCELNPGCHLSANNPEPVEQLRGNKALISRRQVLGCYYQKVIKASFVFLQIGPSPIQMDITCR